MLVFLHQRGEADHVGEHHRRQLPVQVLTHRDGPPPGEVGPGAAHVETLVMTATSIADDGHGTYSADPAASDSRNRFGFCDVATVVSAESATTTVRLVPRYSVKPRLFRSWTRAGSATHDHVSGRGLAQVDGDGSLRGHIYFHLGDHSGFRAVRESAAMT